MHLRIVVGLMVALLSADVHAGRPAPRQDAGIAAFEAGRYEEARTLLERRAAETPDAAAPRYYLGRICFLGRQYEKAVDWLEQAVERQPDSPDYHWWLGQAYVERVDGVNLFRKLSVARKARGAYETAVRLDPDHLDAREDLAYFLFSAPGIAGGDKDAAFRHAEEVRRRHLSRGSILLAKLHAARRELAKAEATLGAIPATHPAHAEATYAWGTILVDAGDYPRAFEVFASLASRGREPLRPDAPGTPFIVNASYQIGRTAGLSGERLDDGLASLAEFLDRREGVAGAIAPAAAHYWMGRIHERKSDRPSALAAYDRALGLNPNHKASQEARRRVGG